MKKYAPVVVFTYSRLDHLKKTIEALRTNLHAQDTVLYIVSDGPAIQEHVAYVHRLRDYVDSVDGFKEVVRIYREKNLGPLNSPLLAEQAIVNDHGSVISLEDDNVTSWNFLSFMNQGLWAFEDDPKIYSICAYLPALVQQNINDAEDFWVYPWNVSWGYAVTKNKYNSVHPLVNRYKEYKASGLLAKQNKAGGLYVTDSLYRDFLKQKPLADAVLGTEMFRLGYKSVLPVVSKVMNIGQDGSGQSSSFATIKYNANLDISKKEIFNFSTESNFSSTYIRRMSRFYNGGITTRLSRHFGLYNSLEALKNKLR